MISTPPDPTLVLTLVAVAEELSFSRAAARLGVTKGTVSRKVSRLEQLVGVELVRRSTHHVSLTAAGRALFERARGPVHALSDVTADLQGPEGALSGAIRITAPPDLAVAFVPDLIESFSALHPAVCFEVRVTSVPLDLVAAGLDLAIRVSMGSLRDSSLVARRVGEVQAGFYASSTYLARRGAPASFGDPAHAWLGFLTGPLPAHHAKSFAALAGAPPGFAPAVSTDDFSLLRELVKRGLGIGILPTFVAEPPGPGEALVRVWPEARMPPRAGIYLVSPSRRQLPRRVEAFRAHAVRLFGAGRQAHGASPSPPEPATTPPAAARRVPGLPRPARGKAP